MPQLNAGLVQVENGQTLVRHVWDLLVISATGDFASEDAVTWGMDGVGVVSLYDQANGRLWLYKTSGSDPVAGDTITNGTQAGSADVDSFGTGSPPSFATDLAPYTGQKKLFTTAGTGQIYEVSESGLLDEEFNLTAPYGEATEELIGYGLQVEFTSKAGLSIIGSGATDAAGFLSRNDAELEQRVGWVGGLWARTVNLALIAGVNGPIFDLEHLNTAGIVTGAAPLLQIPAAGVSMIRVRYALLLDAAVDIDATILPVGPTIKPIHVASKTASTRIQFASGPIPISPNQSITPSVTLSAPANLLASDETWLEIDVLDR